MSTMPDAFDAIPADQGVSAESVAEPEAIASESLPDTGVDETPEADAQTEAPEPTTVKGPVPYDRFEQVNQRKNALEAELAPLAQLKQLYTLAESDPELAAEGFQILSDSLRKAKRGGPDLDSMTDTERALYTELQDVKQQVAQTRQGAQAAQDSIAARELTDAMGVLEREAKDKGLPFDAQAVQDAMDNLNLEKLVRAGKSVEDMARMAFKAVAFDKLPDVVRKQTYASQQKKAGAALAPATSKGGQSSIRVGSVSDAVDAAYKKLGLPDN